MMGLHMEGHLIGVTKMCEGYMWRLIGNVTEKHTSYTWNITRNSNLNFVKNLSTPWHGAVDQDWTSKNACLKITGFYPKFKNPSGLVLM